MQYEELIKNKDYFPLLIKYANGKLALVTKPEQIISGEAFKVLEYNVKRNKEYEF